MANQLADKLISANFTTKHYENNYREGRETREDEQERLAGNKNPNKLHPHFITFIGI